MENAGDYDSENEDMLDATTRDVRADESMEDAGITSEAETSDVLMVDGDSHDSEYELMLEASDDDAMSFFQSGSTLSRSLLSCRGRGDRCLPSWSSASTRSNRCCAGTCKKTGLASHRCTLR